MTFGPAGDAAPVERPTRIIYARAGAGAAPAFALVGAAAVCLYLTRFLVGFANRRG